MKNKTVIQGYTIVDRKRAGDTMVVVGHNPKAPQPYVTWKAYKHSDFKSFDQGHYFSTFKDAMIDFYKRLIEAWEYIPDHVKPTAHQKPRKNEPPVR